MAYSREKDIERRVNYLVLAELGNLKDIFLERARLLAKAQPEEVSPQDAAAAGFDQVRAEYEALNSPHAPELRAGS